MFTSWDCSPGTTGTTGTIGTPAGYPIGDCDVCENLHNIGARYIVDVVVAELVVASFKPYAEVCVAYLKAFDCNSVRDYIETVRESCRYWVNLYNFI